MQHDSLWRLAHSGMQTDDKHTGFWKKWHGPITPYLCVSKLAFKAIRKNIYVCVHCQPKAREIFAVNLASPEKYMVPQRFLFLFMLFMCSVYKSQRRGSDLLQIALQATVVHLT